MPLPRILFLDNIANVKQYQKFECHRGRGSDSFKLKLLFSKLSTEVDSTSIIMSAFYHNYHLYVENFNQSATM